MPIERGALDGPVEAGRPGLAAERGLAVGDEAVGEVGVLVHGKAPGRSWEFERGVGSGRGEGACSDATQVGDAGGGCRQRRAPGAPAMRTGVMAFIVSIGLTSSASGDTVVAG